MFEIVLVEPQIPQNTGNIGRLCLGTGSSLTLVGELGFSLDDKYLKRAGLDYWEKLRVKIVENLDDVIQNISHKKLFFFSKKGNKIFWDANFKIGSTLIFGCETRGLDKEIIEKYWDRVYRIPIGVDVRSLNLSNTVAIVLYEALRQNWKKI